MKGGTRPLGYTIIEVMIVLAVSGLMLVMAASFINGKQVRTSFISGVNEMASRIQDVIAQVSDGQYSDIPITCDSSGNSLTFGYPVGGTPSPQGTNASCVFVGKLLYFYTTGSTPPENYDTFSLAGTRDDQSGLVTSRLVAPIEQPSPPPPVSFTTQAAVAQHLDVQKIGINCPNSLSPCTGGATNTFGFLQGLGAIRGAQSVSLMYAPTTSNSFSSPANSILLGELTSTLVPPFTPYTTSGPGGTPLSITLCLTDQTRYAEIGIGDSSTNNNQVTVNVKMDGTMQPLWC